MIWVATALLSWKDSDRASCRIPVIIIFSKLENKLSLWWLSSILTKRQRRTNANPWGGSLFFLSVLHANATSNCHIKNFRYVLSSVTTCTLRHPTSVCLIPKYTRTIDTSSIRIDNLAHFDITNTLTSINLDTISNNCTLLTDYSYFINQWLVRYIATDCFRFGLCLMNSSRLVPMMAAISFFKRHRLLGMTYLQQQKIESNAGKDLPQPLHLHLLLLMKEPQLHWV